MDQQRVGKTDIGIHPECIASDVEREILEPQMIGTPLIPLHTAVNSERHRSQIHHRRQPPATLGSRRNGIDRRLLSVDSRQGDVEHCIDRVGERNVAHRSGAIEHEAVDAYIRQRRGSRIRLFFGLRNYIVVGVMVIDLHEIDPRSIYLHVIKHYIAHRGRPHVYAAAQTAYGQQSVSRSRQLGSLLGCDAVESVGHHRQIVDVEPDFRESLPERQLHATCLDMTVDKLSGISFDHRGERFGRKQPHHACRSGHGQQRQRADSHSRPFEHTTPQRTSF